jgi:hypothetical protein
VPNRPGTEGLNGVDRLVGVASARSPTVRLGICGVGNVDDYRLIEQAFTIESSRHHGPRRQLRRFMEVTAIHPLRLC